MKRWLLAGAAMLTLGNAAEPELSSSRFGEFEVTAIQDAATTMRRTPPLACVLCVPAS